MANAEDIKRATEILSSPTSRYIDREERNFLLGLITHRSTPKLRIILHKKKLDFGLRCDSIPIKILLSLLDVKELAATLPDTTSLLCITFERTNPTTCEGHLEYEELQNLPMSKSVGKFHDIMKFQLQGCNPSDYSPSQSGSGLEKLSEINVPDGGEIPVEKGDMSVVNTPNQFGSGLEKSSEIDGVMEKSSFEQEQMFIVHTDCGLEKTGIFPRISNPSSHDVSTVLHFLIKQGSLQFWDPDLVRILETFPAFRGISLSSDHKVHFYGADEKLKLDILLTTLPLYIGYSLIGKHIDDLTTSFIPIAVVRDILMDEKITDILDRYECSSSYSLCGSGERHERFKIVHSEPMMVAKWIWDIFGFFKFTLVEEIVVTEECGEPIRTSDGLKGTVAGFFFKEDTVSVLTASHVLRRPGPCMIDGKEIGNTPLLQVEDAETRLISDGQKFTNSLPSGLHLVPSGISSFEISKYGTATGRVVDMVLLEKYFRGWVALGYGVQPTRTTNMFIAKGLVGDSIGGDSGGPWFSRNIGRPSELIAVHRGFVEYYKSGAGAIAPSSSEERLFCGTGIKILLEMAAADGWLWK